MCIRDSINALFGPGGSPGGPTLGGRLAWHLRLSDSAETSPREDCGSDEFWFGRANDQSGALRRAGSGA
eukprot:3779084-Alexandrium_andersonii.AAC.1